MTSLGNNSIGTLNRARKVSKPAITGKESPLSLKEGWLQKQGNYIKNWRERWVQLRPGLLLYYKEPTQEQQPTNFFLLQGCKVYPSNPLRQGICAFELVMANGDKRYLSAQSRAERDEWIKAIKEASVMKPLNAALSITTQQLAPLLPTVDGGEGILLPGSAKPITRISAEDFTFYKVLGKGNYGKVMLATYKDGDGRYFAVKIIKKSSLIDDEALDHILSENRVLQQLSHPFLVKLYCSFQTADRLYFVMEYISGGELFFHIGREKRFSEERVRFYAGEIVLALQYLHSKGIVYRDLKLENILIDSEGHVKITDFGLVKEGIGYGDTTSTFCGTPEYLSPEILEDENYGKDVDWWALGVVLYELLCGRPPFYNGGGGGGGQNMERLFYNILHQTIVYPSTLSVEARDLLSGLLSRDPSTRLGSGSDDGGEIQRHPFFYGVDWSKLLQRKCPVPFIPQITSELDVDNFDKEFTQLPPVLTPESQSMMVQQAQQPLKDFSYNADPELFNLR
ncbi:hypothetical protein MP228_004112 [Amoeboaphelidium protococcarum]|nr:hypothetical protein MP228_004112 [Amoeboaphelidium protococcarum]